MRIYCAACLFVLLLAATAAAYDTRAKTVRDGDSLAVYDPDGALVNIRLYGVDAPEYKQPYGREARKSLAKLVGRRIFSVEPVDTDRYGRTVAILRLKDGTVVNEALVAEGAAWVYDAYCHRKDICPRLRDLQDEARAERLGLWAEDDPERPSDWRKEHKHEEWYKAPARVMRKIARGMKAAVRR